jgi:hypothetical protein
MMCVHNSVTIHMSYPSPIQPTELLLQFLIFINDKIRTAGIHVVYCLVKTKRWEKTVIYRVCQLSSTPS